MRMIWTQLSLSFMMSLMLWSWVWLWGYASPALDQNHPGEHQVGETEDRSHPLLANKKGYCAAESRENVPAWKGLVDAVGRVDPKLESQD